MTKSNCKPVAMVVHALTGDRCDRALIGRTIARVTHTLPSRVGFFWARCGRAHWVGHAPGLAFHDAPMDGELTETPTEIKVAA